MSKLQEVKDILRAINFASMATVNEDGSPHNSPVVFLYDDDFKYIYWGSHPESQHSQNILRTGQAFFAAFDSTKGNVGIYIKTIEGKVVEGNDLKIALEIHNHFRTMRDKEAIELAYYEGESQQKMWRARVEKVWMNAYERRSDGKLVKDYKVEVDLSELRSL
jgi:hypothetical protein